MKRILLGCTSLGLFLSLNLYADDSRYCPQNHGYINVGMTADEVISACGQPSTKQESNKPAMQKVPVQQLIYNNMGTSSAFYGVWNIPTGTSGAQLEVDIVNQKVKSISLNSSDTKAASICQGANIQEGDPVQKVYYSCGTPTIVNNSYIEEIIPTADKPQIWVYQPGEYQPPITLTFINGRLQSIE